ncbi:MAG TPA: D-alanyl-D-alanine carboxypeptidase/D-alanyl-D-alanine-endopeptidase [Gemmatimonadales bacterium]|jgi:D-alanyl-D-alanine carboxypeptidase/D-alanyl-D-alanine-endopeptidase (penicillin-binding protein 4)|nr:D-alanyl-D-alanine carboxypeptidase/D-alanyl-D-alanine-endopeptidase [Gemmatimonadales bacterium]
MQRLIRGWRSNKRADRRGARWLAPGLALLGIVLAAAAPVRLPAQSLQRRLDRRLAAAPWDRTLWGIVVLDERGRQVYGLNADRLFVPASNTKILVTATASALLAPDFTVKTSVYGTGPLTDGVLTGDLVLYGRGDPTFSPRCYGVDTTAPGACDRDPFAKLAELAAQLRARGVRVVRGDLVGDGSYFEPTTVHPAWEGYDLNWWYAAPVSGLGFNDNSIDIHWGPGAEVGAPAAVSFTPDLGDVTLENRTTTAPADSGDAIDFFRTPGTLALWAEGRVGAGSRGGTEYFALPDPALYTARAFRQALAAAGISVLGTTRATVDSMAYREVRGCCQALAEVESRPLKDWVFPILNTSQNWFAEMLLKQVGRQFGGVGSWQKGLEVERRFLIDSVGVDSAAFAVMDGSGLAAADLVTPRAFAQVLRYIARHPRFATFNDALPHAGQPGSLRNRFRGTRLEGRVRAKTGSISRVNTLSGYIDRPDGRTWTFSIQANHHAQRGRDVLAAIDSLVVEMGK